MTRNLLRAGALSCALLTTTAFCTQPALAQTAPPVRHNVDENGVDVVRGTFDFSQTLLSIGPEWPHGLHYSRMREAQSWADNHRGEVYQAGNQIWVSVGNTSAKFTYSGGLNLYNGGTFSSELGDGSTLTRSGGMFTYTNRDGVVARFTAVINSLGRIVAGTGRIVDLRYPNGAAVVFNYRTENVCDEQGSNCTPFFRLQSVTNNFNYQIHYTYAQNAFTAPQDADAWRQVVSLRAINTAVEPCDRYADQCTLILSWPTVTFGTDGSYETVTTPDNNVWRFGGSAGFGIRRPGSSSDDVTVAYDSAERVQSVTGAAGTWTYGYSDNGSTRTTVAQGPLGTGYTITSDPSREIVFTGQDALGRTTSYDYDSQERVTRITSPEGNYTQFTYDARGNPVETRSVGKPQSGAADIVTTASFPASCASPVTCNQPLSVTDARGNTTDFTYDAAHGGVLTATAPAPTVGAIRPQTRISYTAAAVGDETVRFPARIAACQTSASCANGADEVATSVTYSGANFLPTTVTSGRGDGALTASVTRTFDRIGNPEAEDGPLTGNADTARYRHNALRQVTGAVSPDPDGAGPLPHRAERRQYDTAGLLSRVDAGTVTGQSDADWANFVSLERVETERDARGRPITERLMAGSTTYAATQTSYDAAGRPQCTAQRMNPAAFSSLPTSACSLGTEGTFGSDRIVRTSYDAADQVTRVESGVGTAAQADEMVASYRGNGQVETLTDGEGNRTTYAYDGHDRLKQTFYPSPTTDGVSSTTDYEELGYDAAGNVTSMRQRNGHVLGYYYDDLGRQVYLDRAGGEPAVQHFYDLLGRVTQANMWGGIVTFGYDALGRRTYEQHQSRGATQYQHDAAGRRTRTTYPDGFYVAYDHLVTGEVTHIRENGATSGVGVLATYGYDDLGRRTSLTRGNGTSTSYSFDNVSRLSELVQNLSGTTNDLTLGFSHNPAGQIASNTRSNDAYSFTALANQNVTDTHNGLNQVTATGSTSVSHDAKGNTIVIGSNNYGYSVENRMTSGPGGVSMAYDGVGRLDQVSSPSGTTAFLHDGQALIGEYDGNNTLQRRYVHGPGTDEPLVWYEGSGTSDRRFLHADERGSIVATSDSAGAVTAVNRYDEYGQPDSGNIGRFGYTGQAWLPQLSLWYYKARMYNPDTSNGGGRFMQPDPIGYEDGMNLYAYVDGDPVNFVDPLGLQQQESNEDIITALWRFGGGIGGAGGGNGLARGVTMIFGHIFSEDEPMVVTCDMACQARHGVYPRHARPGGLLTRAHRLCRSCHGVGTLPHHRYSTDEENERYLNTTYEALSLFPAVRVARFALSGREIVFSRNLRVAPFGNRTGHPTGRFPHYHRRGTNADGSTQPGQSIRRHRPWDSRSTDRTWRDRF